jgi:hypothetical protein
MDNIWKIIIWNMKDQIENFYFKLLKKTNVHVKLELIFFF